MSQQQQMKIDINKTSPVLTKTGEQIWQQGFLLRKVSRFITGGTDDSLVPIAVFYDAATGEICKEGLPPEVVTLLETSDG